MNELAEIWEIYIFQFGNKIFELYEDLSQCSSSNLVSTQTFSLIFNYCFQTSNVLCYNLSSRFNMHVVFSKLRKYRFLQLNSYFLLKLCFLASADPVSMSVNVYPCFWRCDAWSFSVCAGQREQSCSWCDHVTRMKLNVWTYEDNKWSCLLAWFFTPQCVCTMPMFPKIHVQPSNWKEDLTGQRRPEV